MLLCFPQHLIIVLTRRQTVAFEFMKEQANHTGMCSICKRQRCFIVLNSLNAELNPICHLLSLLVAPHILHVSRIRVKSHKGVLKSHKGDKRFTCITLLSKQRYVCMRRSI